MPHKKSSGGKGGVATQESNRRYKMLMRGEIQPTALFSLEEALVKAGL